MLDGETRRQLCSPLYHQLQPDGEIGFILRFKDGVKVPSIVGQVPSNYLRARAVTTLSGSGIVLAMYLVLPIYL